MLDSFWRNRRLVETGLPRASRRSARPATTRAPAERRSTSPTSRSPEVHSTIIASRISKPPVRLYHRAPEPVVLHTSTIVAAEDVNKERGVAVPCPDRRIDVVGHIVSETLLLKSPNGTPEDMAAAHELRRRRRVGSAPYGLEGVAGRERVPKDTSIAQLISRPEFAMAGEKWPDRSVSTRSTSRRGPVPAGRIGDVTSSAQTIWTCFRGHRHPFNSDSSASALSPRASAVESAFGVTRGQPRTPERRRTASRRSPPALTQRVSRRDGPQANAPGAAIDRIVSLKRISAPNSMTPEIVCQRVRGYVLTPPAGITTPARVLKPRDPPGTRVDGWAPTSGLCSSR